MTIGRDPRTASTPSYAGRGYDAVATPDVTFQGTYLNGIVLSNPKTQNPATIAAGAYVTNRQPVKQANAIYGNSAASWTVTNFGTVKAVSVNGNGIYLKAGGSITNAGAISASGTGYAAAVRLYGAGAVTNTGTIANLAGTQGLGVDLIAGGTLNNTLNEASTGLISGSGRGVEIDGTTASAVNSGTITGGMVGLISKAKTTTINNLGLIADTGAQGYGVFLYAGGNLTNAASGQISGYEGIRVAYASSTIVNNGSITAHGHSGVGVALLSGGNTVINAGTLSGTGGAAFSFGAGNDRLVVDPGSVLRGAIARFQPLETIDLASTPATALAFSGNAAYGTLTVLNGGATVASFLLTGHFAQNEFVLGADGAGGNNITLKEPAGPIVSGVYYDTVLLGSGGIGAAATVTASGTINAAFGHGVRAVGNIAGTLTNAGTVIATETPRAGTPLSLGDGVYLNAGGVVHNIGSTGLIEGAVAGVALGGGSGAVVNGGMIEGGGNTGVGVLLGSAAIGSALPGAAAGSLAEMITNYGSIDGAIGIVASGGNQTVTNAGVIIGRLGTAVTMAGAGDRLALDPGAVFVGIADGGTSGGSVLELMASAGLGGRGAPDIGMLYGIGSSFVNFGTLVVDAGAEWEASGNGANYQFRNDGTILIGNGLVPAGETLTLGPVGEDAGQSGVIAVEAHGVLDIAGAIVAGQTVLFADGTGTMVLRNAAGFTGAIAGFQLGDTLHLASATGVGYANGTLSVRGPTAANLRFSLANPALSGGLVITPDGGGGLLVTLGTASNIFSGSYPSGVTLATADQNQATVTATGSIGNYGVALLGEAGYAWSVTNYGAVYGTGAGGVGIALQSGGAIVNNGLIAGYAVGVSGYGGPMTVLNYADISSAAGTDVYLCAGSTLVNAGTVAGYGGTAVQFAGARDRLMVEPGGGVPRQYRRRRPQRAGADGGGLRQPLRLQQLRHRLFDDYRRRRRLLDVVGRPRRRQADQRRHHRRRQRQRAGVRRRRRRQGPVRRHRTRRQRHRRFHRRGRQGPEPGVHRCLRHGAARRPGGIRGPDRGFQVGDVIDLIGVAADGFRYAKGRLALTEGGDTIATLAFAGHHRQADFQLADDGNGGTDIMLTPASRAPEALSSPAAGPPDFWMARG